MSDFDPMVDDYDEYMDWHRKPKVEHECQDCGGMFEAQASRGKLARCDACADAYERGWGC